jgi:nucleoside-diphosphate-sugar epimerase
VKVTVTGGAGYVGACVVEELLEGDHEVRVLDSLLHGQGDVARDLRAKGAEVVEGDIRDEGARDETIGGADAVVHLAAIVGDPACAKDPEQSRAVNVEGSALVVAAGRQAGAERLVFASTCSNYGRMADPMVPIDETGELAPVSLYAEQKVGIERALLNGEHGDLSPTCLRFATVYGAAPRMRFDLTVNEFTRDLWANRDLEVFGQRFWRPYIHARDAALGVRTVLEAPLPSVANEVFNVGHSEENYRKLDLVELIMDVLGRGNVSYVERDEDPRDYKVSFAKVREALGFETAWNVRQGIEEIVMALEEDRFGEPFDARFSNLTSTPA